MSKPPPPGTREEDAHRAGWLAGYDSRQLEVDQLDAFADRRYAPRTPTSAVSAPTWWRTPSSNSAAASASHPERSPAARPSLTGHRGRTARRGTQCRDPVNVDGQIEPNQQEPWVGVEMNRSI